MRLVLALTLLAGCSPTYPADVDPDAGQPERDTAMPDTSGGTRDVGTHDTHVVDTAAADTTTPDTASAVDTAVDTLTPPTDTAIPITWSTTFPQRPPGLDGMTFDSAPSWFGTGASVGRNERVTGSRNLPVGPWFRSWSATLKLDGGALTCAVPTGITLRWNCEGSSCEGGSSAPVTVSPGSGTMTMNVSGVLSPPPRVMLGQPAPRVLLSIGQNGSASGADCGTLRVWPSAVTVEGD